LSGFFFTQEKTYYNDVDGRRIATNELVASFSV